MKLSEIFAKLAGLEAKVSKIEAAAKPAAITAEQHQQLQTDIAAIKADIAGLDAECKTFETEAANTLKTLGEAKTEITTLKAELANKQKLAEHGAAAAAELAAGQTVAPVPAATEQPGTIEALRAQLAKLKPEDGVQKAVLARKIRELRGLSFNRELVKAT